MSLDSHFNKPGIPIVVASGDCGFAETPLWPTVIPTVTAVGGTSLFRTINVATLSASDRAYWEVVWNQFDTNHSASLTGSSLEAPGSGCSSFESPRNHRGSMTAAAHTARSLTLPRSRATWLFMTPTRSTDGPPREVRARRHPLSPASTHSAAALPAQRGIYTHTSRSSTSPAATTVRVLVPTCARPAQVTTGLLDSAPLAESAHLEEQSSQRSTAQDRLRLRPGTSTDHSPTTSLCPTTYQHVRPHLRDTPDVSRSTAPTALRSTLEMPETEHRHARQLGSNKRVHLPELCVLKTARD